MRVLLLLAGGIALGIVVVTASHQDQEESGIQAKNERDHGDFVNDREIRSTGDDTNKKRRKKVKPGEHSSVFSLLASPVSPKKYKRSLGEISSSKAGKPKKCAGCYTSLSVEDLFKVRKIRSTGGNKKKTKPPRKATPGVFSFLDGPSKTLWKRSAGESPPDKKRKRKCPGCYTSMLIPGSDDLPPLPELRQRRSAREWPRDPKRPPKKCPGCYTSLIRAGSDRLPPLPELRQPRDTEVHGKLRKKHKHLKEKSKSKRRRSKEHREREGHDHFQTEDPEIGHNNKKKRRKHHHRGMKDREQKKEENSRSGMYSILSRGMEKVEDNPSAGSAS